MKNYIKNFPEKKNKYLKFYIVITILLTTVALLYFFAVPYIPPDNSGLIINKTQGIELWHLNIVTTNYDNLSDAEKEEMINSFEASTRTDYKKLLSSVPEIYTEKTFSCYKTPESPVDSNNKNYIIHDYIIHLRTPQQAYITIKICPFEKPLKEIGFTPITSVKSEINGVEITIYNIEKQLKRLLIEFCYNNSFYEIQTYDISITEVEEFLNIILQQ